MLIRTTQIVHLNILYYRPDYQSLIQQFVWSYDDLVPELRRTHQFLWYWKRNIDAVVREVKVGISKDSIQSYRSVDEILGLN